MDIDEGTVTEESAYRRKSKAEIRELAMGVYSGTVFGSWMVRENDLHLLPTIFMPLVALSDVQKKTMRRDGIAHLWANMSDALQRSINGYPIFAKMGFLDQEDASRFDAELDRVREFMSGVDDDVPNTDS